MTEVKFDAIERALGYRFTRQELLLMALTHRSWGAENNERLEFLGDSILNMVIAKALYERFGGLREGELSRLRAQLVRQDALQQIASAINLGDFLRLGEGELRSGGHSRPSILADALEAIFGAVFLDGGHEAASQVIDRLYATMLGELDPARSLKDPKTRLQEYVQSRRLPLPVYELVATRGEAHAQEFEVICQVESLQLKACGSGLSRRTAEQSAARQALVKLGVS